MALTKPKLSLKLRLEPFMQMNDELWWTTQAMQTYGGSFVESLSFAMRTADDVNLKKLVDAFPEYLNEYKPLGQQLKAADKR